MEEHFLHMGKYPLSCGEENKKESKRKNTQLDRQEQQKEAREYTRGERNKKSWHTLVKTQACEKR